MKHASPFIASALTAVLMMGCGSTEQQTSLPTGNSSPPSLSGRVVGESGQIQSGVRVVVHERTSDLKTETVSGSDGSFRLLLAPGVYDLGLDRDGDTSTATCFYGPITVTAQEQQDFILHPSNGKPAHTVSGKMFLQPGVPAANRKVSVRSGHFPVGRGGANPEERVSGTTGADGTFELLLPSDKELGLDIEAYDASGNFDEFVDVGKLTKPLYAELSTELPVSTNRLRSDETDPTLAPPVAGVADPTFTKFNQMSFITDPEGVPYLLLSQGLLPVSSTQRYFADDVISAAVRVQYAPLVDQGLTPEGPMRVDQNGFWWWKYAVNIKPDSKSYWEFTDETDDRYSLSVVITSYWHKVSYNSSKPNIKAVQFVYSQQ